MKKWLPLLQSVAPSIASKLGGPLAGIAVKTLSQALLGKPDATEDEVGAALENASPDAMLELRRLDQQFAVQMAEIDALDRDSARQLYKVDKTPQIVLTGLYTVGYFAILIGLLTNLFTIPEDHKTLMTTLFGVLTAAQLQLINFWFGSSSGSKDKNKVQL